jgi:uncharacterized protein (TIGR00255 family)
MGAPRSMTGHGTGEAPLGRGTVYIEVRSVNHRHVEVRVRMPLELSEHAGFVEELARKLLVRGRVEVAVRVSGETSPLPQLDVGRARAAFEQLVSLRDALCPGEPVPLTLLSNVPDLFVTRGALDLSAARDSLTSAMELACQGVSEMRAREGAALATDLRQRVRNVAQLSDAIDARVPQAVELARKRLAERVELLAPGAPLDSGRLEQEIAFLADRCDVTEETTRLRSHVDQFLELLLRGASDALGRRLDFLLQEMAREANTIGAKSADAEISRHVVELKADVERMREQVQNVL